MPIKSNSMRIPPYLRLIVWCYLLEFAVFFIYRTCHFFYNHPQTAQGSDFFHAFAVGTQFDLSVSAYCLLPLFIILTTGYLSNKEFQKLSQFIFYWFLLFCFLTQLLFAASIPYYNQFGNHLNQNAFLYAKEGKYISSLILGDKGYWGFLLLFLSVFCISTYLFTKSYKAFRSKTAPSTSFGYKVAVVLISSLLLFTALRGRISFKSPLHEGVALISDNNFTNSIAINPNFPFWKELLSKKEAAYQVPAHFDKMLAFTKTYLGVPDSSRYIDRIVPSAVAPNNYNVVVLILESACVFKMGYYNGSKTYPLLDSLVKQSVFFNRFFSSGIHTFNGIFSTLSGYPSLLNEQPLRSYTKQPFNALATTLKKHNYRTTFYTTHDKHFDNMAGFLKMNAYDEIIGDEDISAGKVINNLGVPDHVLYEEFLQRTAAQKDKAPFLSVLMTASDHGPWDVPEGIGFKTSHSKKEENAAAYADWALFQFITNAKKQEWYKHTIFVILGDHGLSMGHTYRMPLSYHHVPLIIYCPELLKPDTISYLAYQPDVGPTILSLLNIPYTNSGFGQNAFEHPRDFVWFTADDKIGAVTKEGYYYFELLDENKRYLYHFANLNSENFLLKKPAFADSLQTNMHALFETARYLIRQNQYSN